MIRLKQWLSHFRHFKNQTTNFMVVAKSIHPIKIAILSLVIFVWLAFFYFGVDQKNDVESSNIETNHTQIPLKKAADYSVKNPPPGNPILTRIQFNDIKGYYGDDYLEALKTFEKSCQRINNLHPDSRLGNKLIVIFARDYQIICRQLAFDQLQSRQDQQDFIEKWFVPFTIEDQGRTHGLATGYYQTSLEVSHKSDAIYQTPILQPPKDLPAGNLWNKKHSDQPQPYLTRSQIIDRAKDSNGNFLTDVSLSNDFLRGDVLYWAKDPLALFILQVQGSGIGILPDGKNVRIGYAGHNGQKYQSIARYLIDQKALTPQQGSWQHIRSWLADNPTKLDHLFNQNPRYIYFREVTGVGAIGGEGVPLTPERSIAVDTRVIPYGVPVFIDTHMPKTTNGSPLRRLMIAQDTGNAIKGVVRIDYFWGAGEIARDNANHMKAPLTLTLFIPRTAIENLNINKN